jgi:hypothetical protein
MKRQVRLYLIHLNELENLTSRVLISARTNISEIKRRQQFLHDKWAAPRRLLVRLQLRYFEEE